jgi:hypothetical protein
LFTYEWLGEMPECGVPRILDRSTTVSKNDEQAIAHAKSLLKTGTDLPAGRLYGVRVFNAQNTLIWRGNVEDWTGSASSIQISQ